VSAVWKAFRWPRSRAGARASALLLCAAAAAAALATLLGGCGKKEAEPVTIRYLRWTDPAELAATREILDLFQQRHPNVTVTLEFNSWDQYWPKLQTLLAAGDPPDVFMMSGLYFHDFQSRGVLADLTTHVNTSDLDLDDFYALPRRAFTVDGRLYALPRDFNIIALFYNRKLFQDAGLAEPDSSWTWEDLRRAARKLTRDTDGDGKNDVWGFQVMNELETSWGNFVYQNEGAVVNATGRRCLLADPGAVEAIRFLHDLIYQDHVSPNPVEVEAMPGQAFRAGRVAMVTNGSWMLRSLDEVATLDYGVAPLARGKRRAAIANGVANAIAAQSKHPDVAWELVRFLSGPEAQEALARSGTSIPVLRRVAESPAYLEQGLGSIESKRVFLSEMAYAVPIPFTPGFARWYEDVKNALDRVWLDKEAPSQALTDAAAKVNAVLAGNGGAPTGQEAGGGEAP
jgi:multiple sugar transport system substrate-binding protein